MPSVFQKLNLTTQREILVLNAPESFDGELAGLAGVQVQRDLKKVAKAAFALAFVTAQAQLDTLTPQLVKKLDGDAVLWFAYPKGTSKRYRCDFNRDSGWQAIRAAGFDSVRQIAVDEDWSALRFRRLEFIKVSTRRPAPAVVSRVTRAR